jgi:hypothetical protein
MRITAIMEPETGLPEGFCKVSLAASAQDQYSARRSRPAAASDAVAITQNNMEPQPMSGRFPDDAAYARLFLFFALLWIIFFAGLATGVLP